LPKLFPSIIANKELEDIDQVVFEKLRQQSGTALCPHASEALQDGAGDEGPEEEE
jgi:hypothetical protein